MGWEPRRTNKSFARRRRIDGIFISRSGVFARESATSTSFERKIPLSLGKFRRLVVSTKKKKKKKKRRNQRNKTRVMIFPRSRRFQFPLGKGLSSFTNAFAYYSPSSLHATARQRTKRKRKTDVDIKNICETRKTHVATKVRARTCYTTDPRIHGIQTK